MKTQDKRRRGGQEGGFTLVELMVSLVLAAILIVGIYQLYQSTQNTYLAQDQLAELQQNARIGIEEMIREMRLAGYLANCSPVTATATMFEFEADTDLSGKPERIIYKLDTTGSPPKNQLLRASSGDLGVALNCATSYDSTATSNGLYQAVASNVTSLSFGYYNTGDCLMGSDPLNCPAIVLADIRRITISLGVAKAKAEESAGTRTVTVASDVRMRDTGLSGGPGTCNKPDPPSLTASDPKICGRAKLTWTDSSAQTKGVTNYRVYWKPNGTTAWSVKDIGIPTNPANTYMLNGLVNGNSYDFAIAGQNSCDLSKLSSTMTVSLSDSIAPVVPTGADATASTAGASQVNLSWTATNTIDGGGKSYPPGDANYDVASYNIYRSIYDPVAKACGAFGSSIATVAVPATTYTDTTGLNKCTQYCYKVAAMDQCNNISDINSSSAVYGDATGKNADLPTKDVTNTYPSNATAPAAPTAFTAIAGGEHPAGSKNYRVNLSWINPSDSSFAGTRIQYNSSSGSCSVAKGDYPANATSGTNLSPDQPGQPGSSDSRYDDIYRNNTYYCFTAFAYDNCPNYSTGAQATAQAKTCGDDPTGPPPAVTSNLTLTNCCDATGENRGVVSFTWSYTHSQTDIPDLVGFNVYRTNAPNNYGHQLTISGETYSMITPSPVFFPSSFIPKYDDNDNSSSQIALNPGTTYKYVVTVVDCLWPVTTPVVHESAPSPVLTVQPGKIDRDTNVNVTLTGTKAKQYNIVNFSFKNTSASTMTFKGSSFTGQAVVTWTTVSNNARLTKMVLDGTTLWADPTWVANSIPPSQPEPCVSGSCSTTVTFTGTYDFAALSSGKAVALTFSNTDGTTNLDMRGRTITIAPSYRNDTAAISNSSIPACTNNPAISISTSLGATVSGTTQAPPTDVNGAGTPPKSAAPGYTVPATSPVTITSQAIPQNGTSIFSVKIWYYADGSFLSTAPDPSSVSPIYTYTNVPMSCVSGIPPNCSGDLWTGNIPANPGKRVWFYVEAVDNKGNYSDDPSNATTTVFTAFTYDQPATITVKFTASFVDPANGDNHVKVTGTATDQGGSPVQNANVIFTIASDVLTGTTDSSGNFSATSNTNFTSGDVLVKVAVAESPNYVPGTCSNTLVASATSVSCPF